MINPLLVAAPLLASLLPYYYPLVGWHRQVFAGHMRNGTTKGFQADYAQPPTTANNLPPQPDQLPPDTFSGPTTPAPAPNYLFHTTTQSLPITPL